MYTNIYTTDIKLSYTMKTGYDVQVVDIIKPYRRTGALLKRYPQKGYIHKIIYM